MTIAVKVFDRDLSTTGRIERRTLSQRQKDASPSQYGNTWGTSYRTLSILVLTIFLYLPPIHLPSLVFAAHRMNLLTIRIAARQRSWFRGSLHERHVVCDLSRESETGREGKRQGKERASAVTGCDGTWGARKGNAL